MAAQDTDTIPQTLARRALLAAAVSAFSIAAVAPAQGALVRAPGAPLVTLRVVDRETGEAARVWRHAGKVYVAGQPGARYSLRVTNNSGGRVLAVVSVDGVNIVSGETAAYDQRGYVLAPFATHDIKGWRKSNEEIAAFNFAPLADSYAARTGRPDNVGVIGVAAFREREAPAVSAGPPISPPVSRGARAAAEARMRDEAPPPLPIPPVERRVETPAPAAPSSAMARAEAYRPSPSSPSVKLGTGHGAREWSRVTLVDFERAGPLPNYVYRLEYDSPARLIAAGVIPRPRPVPAAPTPFPGSRDGFVPDPPYGG